MNNFFWILSDSEAPERAQHDATGGGTAQCIRRPARPRKNIFTLLCLLAVDTGPAEIQENQKSVVETKLVYRFAVDLQGKQGSSVSFGSAHAMTTFSHRFMYTH